MAHNSSLKEHRNSGLNRRKGKAEVRAAQPKHSHQSLVRIEGVAAIAKKPDITNAAGQNPIPGTGVVPEMALASSPGA